jgi:hypothetical protein
MRMCDTTSHLCPLHVCAYARYSTYSTHKILCPERALSIKGVPGAQGHRGTGARRHGGTDAGTRSAAPRVIELLSQTPRRERSPSLSRSRRRGAACACAKARVCGCAVCSVRGCGRSAGCTKVTEEKADLLVVPALSRHFSLHVPTRHPTCRRGQHLRGAQTGARRRGCGRTPRAAHAAHMRMHSPARAGS